MKNTIKAFIMFFLICCMVSSSYAQHYKSIFGNTSTSWNVIHHGWCDAIISNEVIATIDTIVGSKTYKVVYGPSGFFKRRYYFGESLVL